MKMSDLRGMVSVAGAGVASLCCVLPLAIVLLGLGTGAFMATTMRYTPIFVPVGIVSVAVGVALHLRERGRCAARGCKMAGGAVQVVLLGFSAVVVAAAVFFSVFPETASEFLMKTMEH
jgi:hypothetical protein